VLASSEETVYIERGTDGELGLDVCKKANWYPRDYKYKHCKIDRQLTDGETLKLESCKMTPIIIAGHSYGVLCLLAEMGTRRVFFSSDTAFFGGTIGLGNWPGSSLQAYRENIRKFSGLNVDELYPGHNLWTLKNGQMHLDKAVDNLTYGWVPPIGSHNHPVY
jgi:glyoxylase-like metal-dependent hydrolase (beta-lactamase superfamily II)